MKNRIAHIDLLRILSILFVIYNHTESAGYSLFSAKPDSPFYFVYMAFSVLCKVAVPIFFMISGALLLKKEESIVEVFRKRVLRIVLVLLIASVPYYVWLHRGGDFGVFDFFQTVYQTSTTTSYWYLYSYLGVLLMLPLLQKLAKAMTNQEFVYVIGGYVVLTGILPALELVFSGGTVVLNPSFSAVLLSTSNIVYVLAGYFLENRLKKECFTARNMGILGAASLISIAVTCALTQVNVSFVGWSDFNKVEGYFNSFIIIPAVTLYFVAKGTVSGIRISERTGTAIATLGASVFGTYLIEKIVRAATAFVYSCLNPYIGSFAASLIWVLVVAVVGLTFVTILKKLPYISKLVNRLI